MNWLLRALVLLFFVASTAYASEVTIPQTSALYRLQLEREVASRFGLDAPVARLAAQIHQESGWHPHAASAYAQGLAQFTPSTAKWLPLICADVGKPDPWDPGWSLRAIACYDAWLSDRVQPIGDRRLDACTRWNFALRGYNGGEAMLLRERRMAKRAGANPNDWLAVKPFSARAGWAHRENIGYPIRILLTLEPAYLDAGWPGTAVCS